MPLVHHGSRRVSSSVPENQRFDALLAKHGVQKRASHPFQVV